MSSAFDTEDPIAAKASAPGAGLRGLVRVSGPGAWRIALAGFEPKSNASPPGGGRQTPQGLDEGDDRHRLETAAPDEYPTPIAPSSGPTGHLPPPGGKAFVLTGSYRLPGLRPLLPASVALWPAPRTYTGQELAEIHAPGSSPLLDRLLAQVLSQGARPARPGEFTLRAFLSGRIDLTRAEAVLGVIDARDSQRLDAALEQLAGGLAGPIGALRDRLLDLLAHLEADLDFVDEADVDPIGRAALAEELDREAATLDALTDRLGRRDRSGDAPLVVLVGLPNAGKSRLFNALLGDDHAIVSPVAGATRDTLSALCPCNGLVVELVDTAGLESAGDAIAAEAQNRRSAASDRADLILACSSVDARAPETPDDDRIVPVWTKSDLVPPPSHDPTPWLLTSARNGFGLDVLKQKIADQIRRRESESSATGTAARCRDALTRSAASLRSAAAVMLAGGGDELIAFELRAALDDLGEVTGVIVADDVLDRIFARFCIGK